MKLRLGGLVPEGRVAWGATSVLWVLMVVALLGEQQARLAGLDVPAFGAWPWILALLVTAFLAPPASRPASARLFVCLALLLVTAVVVLDNWRGRLLDPTAAVPVTLRHTERPEEPPVTGTLDLARAARRIPLMSLVRRVQHVALETDFELWAPEAGRYRLRAEADDEVAVVVDGSPTLVAAPAAAAPLELTRGWHHVHLRYVQNSGAAWFQLAWDRPAFFEPSPLFHFVATTPSEARAAALEARQDELSLALLLRVLAALLTSVLAVRAVQARHAFFAWTWRAVGGGRETGPVIALAGLLFLFSGFAALVYQVAWQRLLTLHSGVGAYAVAMVVAAFMAGLGIGSHLGGLLSLRLDRSAALRGFALIEMSIGVFALLSVTLYYDVLYVHAPALYQRLGTAALAHFLALLLPTTLMGMSLPLLARSLVLETRTAARTIGYLYAINVVGAATGALLTPWVLVRHLGLDGAIRVGAIASCVAGLGAFGLRWLAASRGLGRDDASAGEAAPRPAAPAAPETEVAGSRPFSFWLVLYAVSGFCALSLEIVWFRLVDVSVKSSAFAFGTVLAIYLAGLAIGAFIGTGRAERLRHPLRAFLTCQCLIALYAALAALALAHMPWDWFGGRWLARYWSDYGGFKLGADWSLGPLLGLYVVLPAALYLVPTILMGLSFPILQRAVQEAPETSGQRVGFLQAANIVGCVAGSLLTGLLVLDLGGSPAAFRVVLVGASVLAVVGMRAYGWRGRFAAFAAACLALALSYPGIVGLWGRVHGPNGPEGLIDEDASSVVGLIPRGPGSWRVTVNGTGNSQLPFGGMHSLLGALPALVHPAPRSIAVIGLGSGDTAWAAACRSETERLKVFEIAGRQVRLLRGVAAREGYPPLKQVLSDPRISIALEDGRLALRRGAERYDAIEMDALEPNWAFSGYIYSIEFMRLCATRLAPGGIVCMWSPTPRVKRSFLASFPYCVAFRWGTVLVGSNEPIPVDPQAWLARLADPRIQAYLGTETARKVGDILGGGDHAQPDPLPGEVNTDLFPRDEFMTPGR